MLTQTGAIIVISLVVGLGISAVVLSTIILRRGKLYHRLNPEARPRRWLLISMLVLFAVFITWFPVWMTWPHALIPRLLTGLFAITFGSVCLTYKWLAGPMDAYIKRKGWPLL